MGTRTLLIAASCAAMLGACESEQAASDARATLGVMLPLSGPLADVGVTAEHAAQLAVEEINAHGGVWGAPLRVEYRDSQTDDAVAAAQATTWVEDQELGLVVAAVAVPVAEAILKETVPRGAVVLASLAGSEDLGEDRQGWFYRTLPVRNLADNWSTWWNGEFYADGHRRILYVFNELLVDNATLFSDNFLSVCDSGDCEVELRSFPAEHEVADLRALLSDLGTSPPDVLTLLGLEGEVASLLQETQVHGYEGALMVNDLFGLVGSAFTEVLQPSTVARVRWVDAATADVSDAVTYGERIEALHGMPGSLGLGQYATYDAVMVAALALAHAGTNSGPGVAESLEAVANGPGVKVGPFDYERAVGLITAGEDIDYEGLVVGDFDAGGENTKDPDATFYGWDADGRVVPWEGR